MLTIYLHRSQQGLLDELEERCPDLLPARSLYPNHTTYRCALDERELGRRQKIWLAEHHVLFVDSERVRERRARAFLHNVALDAGGQEPHYVTFRRVDHDPACHFVQARSREQEGIALYLLADWTGREPVGYARRIDGLWVCRDEGALLAYCLNERGCPAHVIQSARTPAELEAWLLEQRFLQVLCSEPEPGVCGFYLFVREEGIPEMLGVEE